jgi:hypothetical protein
MLDQLTFLGLAKDIFAIFEAGDQRRIEQIGHRHCEQSEAIQVPRRWIASSLSLRAMTVIGRTAP